MPDIAETIPHSRETEEAVIGSVLINPDVYPLVRGECGAQDFYIHRHRWIFEAFDRLSNRAEPIDLLTVSEEIASVGKLEELGGAAFLTALVNQVPTSLHAEAYAKKVRGYAIRRNLLKAANNMATEAYRLDKGIDDVISTSTKSVDEAIRNTGGGSFEKVGDVVSRVYDRVDENSRKTEEEKDVGLKTGFKDLDNLLGGLEDDDLFYIAARPGVGKSALLLNIARNVGLGKVKFQEPKGVAILSLEMGNEQNTRRILAQMSGISSQRIKSGTLKDDEWPKFIHAVDELSAAPIYFDQSSGLFPHQLRAKVLSLKMKHDIGLIIIDYIQLMDENGENQNVRVSHISRKLKTLADECKTPIMAASQLSRKAEDGRPMLHHLRDSGSLEQDGSKIGLLFQKEDQVNVTYLDIAKHRDGPTGTIELIASPHLTKFEDAKKIHVNMNNRKDTHER